jgi:hypothetical protein
MTRSQVAVCLPPAHSHLRVSQFFSPVRVAHTLLGTVKLLYRCKLFQPLYFCAYLQLLSRGLESKVLPVKNYCYRQRTTDRVKHGGSTLPKNSQKYMDYNRKNGIGSDFCGTRATKSNPTNLQLLSVEQLISYELRALGAAILT